MKTKQFRYSNNIFDISKTPTFVEDSSKDLKKIKEQIKKNVKRIRKAQAKLYARHEYSILIILQGMDSAGKDSMIKHILSGVNPSGFNVASFKQPTAEELAHDYLWRINKKLPARGHVGIFIRHFENYLTRNGYVILKFFLNLSKQEQKKRFMARIDTPSKNWKLSASDIRERQYWNKYQAVYEKAINSTSTKKNPWYVIPSDDKWYSRLIVSDILTKRIEKLPLAYPTMSPNQEKELELAKELLEDEGKY